MKLDIGEVEHYKKGYSLTIKFSDVTNRKLLEKLVKELFFENANHIFSDYFEAFNNGRWIGKYWGRTPKFFDGRVECDAKYSLACAEISLRMPKKQLVNYLTGLNNVPGISLPEGYLEKILNFE